MVFQTMDHIASLLKPTMTSSVLMPRFTSRVSQLTLFQTYRASSILFFASAVIVITLFSTQQASAQAGLQSPADFLGYELGDRFTRHAEVMDYVEHVARNSERVNLQTYGRTYENRKLVLAMVSTPSNLGQLEKIRLDNLRLTGLEKGETGPEPKSVVWLSYNVHGNESVSSEAAMATLYELADESNQKTGSWLENTVVIIDPVINPDGRDRYVNWYNQMVGVQRNVNPDAIEHREPAPGGRTNHYYFDLNRDWTWLTQVETQSRIQVYNQWMPHVHVDFHEQGVNEPYYFAPAAEPFHDVITPWQREFQTTIGLNHAKYFDQNGWLYFTKQSFDLYYPGYGDTFPTYNGSIGMTYEQGGSRRAGLGIMMATGDTLTLANRISHHHTTGMSTVEMASVHNERLVSEFETFFSNAVSDPPGGYSTYVIKRDKGGKRVEALKAHLDKLGISSGTVTQSSGSNGWSYRSSEDVSFDIEPGDLVIDAHQPRATLLSVLFEPVSAISDSLTYDITAWALPYAYDVQAYATTARISGGASFSDSRGGLTASSDDPYAYIIRWNDVADIKFLAAIFQADIKVRAAEKAFSIEGQRYEPGTLIITKTDNTKHGTSLRSKLAHLADTYGEVVTGVRTGFVDSGADLGSSDVNYIKRPKIAVLRGSPVSSSSTGQLWHFFDQQIEYPVTMVQASSLGSLDLDDYTVLILPSGSYGDILNEAGLDKVKAWVRGGGNLIAIRGASSFLVGKDGFSLKKKEEDKKDDEEKLSEEEEDAKNLRKFGDRSRERARTAIPGAIFKIQIDNSHPLGFGFASDSFILKRGTNSVPYMDGSNDWNVGVIRKKALVSGQVGHKAFEKVDRTLAFGVQNMGSGRIVYLIDDPLFRGFWYSGRMLMGNAIFQVGN